MIQWRDLIAASRLLASVSDSDTVPLPDSLRRAVSTAYYTVFHALANSNADCLSGRRPIRCWNTHGTAFDAASTTTKPEETSNRIAIGSHPRYRSS